MDRLHTQSVEPWEGELDDNECPNESVLVSLGL